MIPPEIIPVEYRKLPGSGRRRGVVLTSPESHRLWRGPNHLLLVQTTFGIEEYKRFYFKDIQALTIRRNRWNPGLPLAAGVMLAASVVATLAAAPTAAQVLSWIGAAGLLAALGIYLWRGPGCRCFLRTAVQVQELFSLRHWRSARRVLAIVGPLIEREQGALAGEFIQAALLESGGGAPAPAARRSLAGPAAPLVVRPYRSIVHSLFFAALIVLALEQAGFLAGRSKVWLWLELPSYPLCLGCAVLSLVRQRGTDLDARVTGVAWVGTGLIGSEALLGYAWTILTAVNHPEANFDITRRIELMAASPPLPGSFVFALSAVMAAAAFLLGLIGLVLRARTAPANPAETPSNPGQP